MQPPSLRGKPLNTALSVRVCMHVRVAPGISPQKPGMLRIMILALILKRLILFAFCASRVFLLFSASVRTWNTL